MTRFRLLVLPILGFAKDFLWLSQSEDCPQWLHDVSEQPNSYVLVGVYGGPCGHGAQDVTQKLRFICLDQMDVVKGRKVLFAHGDAWEQQRLQLGLDRFHYFIWADDNAEFDFMPANGLCTPEDCGDASLLPRQNEKATMYWQRLLEQDQPAVASAIIHDAWCLEATKSMYSCTSNLDGKQMAFHWSVRKILAVYVEEFAQVSCNVPLTYVPIELMESAFRGYTWTYRMFDRTGNSTRFPEPRATYIHNLHPSFPRLLRDGSWGDSQLVAWLRPQLTNCASENLGPSAELQRSCLSQSCLKPPVDVNYSAFLPCLPWASEDSEDYCRPKVVGNGLSKLAEDWVKDVLPGMLGFGLAHLPNYTNGSTTDLCRLGQSNVDALIRWFNAPGNSRGAKVLQTALDGARNGGCSDPCTAMLLVAGGLASSATSQSLRQIHDSCRFNFLRSWSMLDLLGSGWVSLFELTQRETERRALRTHKSMSLVKLQAKLAQVSAAEWQEISHGDDVTNFVCDVQKAVKLLLEHTEDIWRSGSVHAASRLLFNCKYETLLHPRMAPVWGLAVLLGHMGVQAHLPPSRCEQKIEFDRRGLISHFASQPATARPKFSRSKCGLGLSAVRELCK